MVASRVVDKAILFGLHEDLIVNRLIVSLAEQQMRETNR